MGRQLSNHSATVHSALVQMGRCDSEQSPNDQSPMKATGLTHCNISEEQAKQHEQIQSDGMLVDFHAGHRDICPAAGHV
jgi:hypothetical protein